MPGWAPKVRSRCPRRRIAGSAQFAAASILDSGGGAAAAIVAALLLNAATSRQPRGGVDLSRLAPAPHARVAADRRESWALAGHSGRFEYGVLVGAGIVLYVVWVGGTALGTVAGDLLDPEAIGLDAALPGALPCAARARTCAAAALS